MKTAQQSATGIFTMESSVAPKAAYPSARNSTLRLRLAHAAIAGALAATLLLSFLLKPDPRGVGTHEQLLIFKCNFYSLTKLPCPFCGMTTAFAHMARGEVREALMAQPMGAVGFVACSLLFFIAMGAIVSGKDATGRIFDMLSGKLSWIVVGMLACAWLFKIAITVAH